jgi:hypothetical protein
MTAGRPCSLSRSPPSGRDRHQKIEQFRRAWPAASRSRRQGHAQEDLLEQRGVCPPEETLAGGRALGASDVKVVHARKRGELAVALAVTPVMMQRQLAVASLHTGPAALEQIGAGAGDLFDVRSPLARGAAADDRRAAARRATRYSTPARDFGFRQRCCGRRRARGRWRG